MRLKINFLLFATLSMLVLAPVLSWSQTTEAERSDFRLMNSAAADAEQGLASLGDAIRVTNSTNKVVLASTLGNFNGGISSVELAIAILIHGDAEIAGVILDSATAPLPTNSVSSAWGRIDAAITDLNSSQTSLTQALALTGMPSSYYTALNSAKTSVASALSKLNSLNRNLGYLTVVPNSYPRVEGPHGDEINALETGYSSLVHKQRVLTALQAFYGSMDALYSATGYGLIADIIGQAVQASQMVRGTLLNIAGIPLDFNECNMNRFFLVQYAMGKIEQPTANASNVPDGASFVFSEGMKNIMDLLPEMVVRPTAVAQRAEFIFQWAEFWRYANGTLFKSMTFPDANVLAQIRANKLPGQEPSDTVTCLMTPPTTTFSISGRVLVGSSGLAGATVSAGVIKSTTTAADGSYSITGLLADTYIVTAAKTGYNLSAPITVTLPPDATGINFTASATPDAIPPSVSITAPANGATVSGVISITGLSADNVLVSSVAVSIDGGTYSLALGTLTWTFTLNTVGLTNAAHTITAKATDSSGNVATVSRTVSVVNTLPDTTPPSVAVIAPANNASVSGSIAVTGTAADNVLISSVAVSVDGGAYSLAAGTSSWTFSLNTVPLSNGSHSLIAKAVDSSGNSTTAAVNISVSNGSSGPTPPTVGITFPANGATVSGVVTIFGTAADNVLVSSVAVSIDGGVYSLAAGTASWIFNLTTLTLSNGNHTLTAKATDNTGVNTTVSITVIVSNVVADNIPPTLAITVPANNSMVSGSVSIQGTAADNIAVSSVAISLDGGAFSPAVGIGSWTFNLNTVPLSNGSHSLIAKATDKSGNIATASVTLMVSNIVPDTTPPTIVIVAPGNNATISGTITLVGASVDNVAVSNVRVSVDGGTYALAVGTANWTFSLNTGSLAAGSHTITAKATDPSGNATTASITVTVAANQGADATPGLHSLMVYPNPAIQQDPVIRVFMGVLTSLEITIFDISGQSVYSGSMSGPPTGILNGQYYYDYRWTGHKTSGLYFATVHGKAADGSIVKARVKFAVVQ